MKGEVISISNFTFPTLQCDLVLISRSSLKPIASSFPSNFNEKTCKLDATPFPTSDLGLPHSCAKISILTIVEDLNYYVQHKRNRKKVQTENYVS